MFLVTVLSRALATDLLMFLVTVLSRALATDLSMFLPMAASVNDVSDAGDGDDDENGNAASDDAF
jgi:hypothetical protein